MKVIDLLNKIANDEEVPKKIRYEDIIYTYNEYDKDYFEIPISEDEYRGLFNMKDSILTQYLTDEVEIIEDTPKEDNQYINSQIELLLKELNDITVQLSILTGEDNE